MLRTTERTVPPHPDRIYRCDPTSPRKRGEVSKTSLPVRIRIYHAAPAGAVERLPLAFSLREAIGHRIDHGGMMTHAAMAAFDFDAFRLRGGFFHAALPRADTVGAAEDRGGRHRRRFRQRATEAAIFLVGAAAAGQLIDAPGVGRLRAAGERTAERNHRAHAIRHHFCQLTRVETAEAPADQTDLAAMRIAEFLHQIDHRVLHALAQTEIAALTPAADGITAAFQERA